MTTGKTIVLVRQTFVDKVMSLLFNMLSRFVKAFLPRTEHLLISRLQSPSAVILEPKKRVSVLRCRMDSVKDSRGSMEPPGLSPSVPRKPQGRAHIWDVQQRLALHHKSMHHVPCDIPVGNKKVSTPHLRKLKMSCLITGPQRRKHSQLISDS